MCIRDSVECVKESFAKDIASYKPLENVAGGEVI